MESHILAYRLTNERRCEVHEIAERDEWPCCAHKAREPVEIEEVALLPELERRGEIWIRRRDIDEHGGNHDEHCGDDEPRVARQRHCGKRDCESDTEPELRTMREPRQAAA